MARMNLPMVDSKYGAPMGRTGNITEPDYPVRFNLQKLRWVDGDYDEGGAYWGKSTAGDIYWARGEGEEEVQEMFVRAHDFEDAKKMVRTKFENATFEPLQESFTIEEKKYARKDDGDFIIGAARSFYCEWWASWMEDHGRSVHGEITEQAPATQRWAFKLARELVIKIVEMRRGPGFPKIMKEWRETWEAYKYSDRDCTEYMMGFYAAMSAMGQGVGLADFGIKDRMPHMEASY